MRLTSPAPRRPRGPHAALAAAVLVLLGACDIPTSSPIVDSRWVVPSQSTSIGVANLLPTGVTVVADSSAFVVTAAASTVSRALSQDCAACVAVNGLTSPKPAFVGNVSSTTAVSADVASASITSGTLQVTVTNGYTFDPLRPSAAAGSARGFAVITITSGSVVLGKDSVNGASVALAANGGVLTRSIPLSGAFSGAPITMSVVLNSPLGDPVLIDVSRSVTVALAPTSLRVASASVNVVNRTVTSTTNMNLADIDSSITNHVLSGALLMNVVNPFNVTGTLTAKFAPSGGGAPIIKTVALIAGTSTPSVAFSAADLHALLGHDVTLTLSGIVNGFGGAIALTPKQIVSVTTHLDISLEVGGH